METPFSQTPPIPGSQAGLAALKALIRSRSVLAALEAIFREMGDIFQISLPGFRPVFLVGPQANHFVTVSGRGNLRWRPEGDPVAQLLRKGVLVTDGDEHNTLRRALTPALHRRRMPEYVGSMLSITDAMTRQWPSDRPVDALVEMRKIALLILFETLFAVDLRPDLPRVWPHLLRTIAYISPGLWLLIPGLPRFGYRRSIRIMDQYLYEIISRRRSQIHHYGEDMLSSLVRNPEMDDDLIRDQLLTILIAGHDTSTALLAWTLYLVAAHPPVSTRLRQEIDEKLAGELPNHETVLDLPYLDQVIQESLRLYPPIHIGNRLAAVDLEYGGCHIPAGSRVVYSIYLTHRDPRYWPDPEKFDPERFAPGAGSDRPHYAYLPFGGGPRNCIGMAFAQVEARVILARLLQTFDFELPTGEEEHVHPHMGATLEPYPQVRLIARRREV